jgi:hypothetical protein
MARSGIGFFLLLVWGASWEWKPSFSHRGWHTGQLMASKHPRI